MNIQIAQKREIEREKKLASLTAKRYDILRVLYTGDEYILTTLRDTIRNLEEKKIDLGNFSRDIKTLENNGLVLKENGQIKISTKAQELVYVIMEAARPEDEKLWQPQPEEIKLCLEALVAREAEEVRKGFLWDLGSILDSGYWDPQLETFFTRALNHPEDFEKEIEELLRARRNRPEKIERFLKSKREELYNLVKRSNGISLEAFGAFFDVSEGKEVLDKLETALEGEEVETVFAAARHYSRRLYERFGLEFTRILYEALKHERGSVREIAVETMKEIARRRRAL